MFDSQLTNEMSFNGDAKRQRMDCELATQQRVVEATLNDVNAFEPRRKRPEEQKANHILLYTIINPMFPITVDVLHTISQPHGQVLRIVIFKKNGVQAMVEFDNTETAIRAKEALHGADIYSGCCTLKIDYAKPDKLNVHKNDADSWDYTVGLSNQTNGSRSQPLLPDPHFAPRAHTFPSATTAMVAASFPTNEQPPVFDEFTPNFNNSPATTNGSSGTALIANTALQDRSAVFQNTQVGISNKTQQGCVIMVYGLDPQKTNTDKLFNLVCLYGNVSRIKFLKTKEGTAMVQMGDNVACERCIQNLNNVVVAGEKEQHLQLAFSKQAYLGEVTNPYPLADKTPSFKDYSANKNNRFLNAMMASKNRIQPPSKILHFFNTPPNITERTILNVFKDYGVTAPSTIKMFPNRSERSSSGLLEFKTIGEAVAALMNCNHAAIECAGTKFPFIMKLCFSSTRNLQTVKLENATNGTTTNNNNNNNSMDKDGSGSS